MERYRRSYYSDENFIISIYVNNTPLWESTRITIKNGDRKREVYKDFKHTHKVTIREIIKDITNKIIYKD
jgi:excinuclease UvrABC helicase subunit UvrB